MALWGNENDATTFEGSSDTSKERMTGAQFIAAFLERRGVKQVYGIPGAAILPFYDAIRERNFASYNVRHEQTAIFMADGFARTTGQVGVCAATSGPGATNFLTGLYSAYSDSIPLLALTGQVPTSLIGKDSFQEAPILEMARPVTKAAYQIMKTADLPTIMNEAWQLATTGRKGPILLDLPLDVQKGSLAVDWNALDAALDLNLQSSPKQEIAQSELNTIHTMLCEAKTPTLLVGGGVALGNASAELLDLAELLHIPVVSSLMGKDAFPNDHPLYAGLMGTMCQTPLGNKTILESDLIINLGGRFDGRGTGDVKQFKAGRKVIHINLDKQELSRHIPTEISLAVDIRDFIDQFLNLLRDKNYSPSAQAQARIHSLQEERTRLARQTVFNTFPLKPQQAIAEVRGALDRDAILTLDCGISQIWTTQLYDAYVPRSFLITGRAGTMGWGLGAALGAKLAFPERQVVNLLGDASLGMSLQELATAAKHNIPVVVVVLNNSLFGLIRQQQNLLFNQRCISTDLEYENRVQGHSRGLDFVATAQGMGVEAELVDKPGKLPEALQRAFSSDRPYLIEVLVDPTAQCSVSLDGTLTGVRELE
ncbi:thiamine pyrophosphate-dependent enzyme, possible carboligase or decarboxylase [Desulfitobacterium dichloroeliminans LMG P-21439]|uniref:Thiamine pyrophosphate-dependent enzyme, possible carboligase or decarboxylase n=1 Tax=Desulfitobacterium dichloroeliminans (strain LMG P-21439 / DCA1) TaxID=871963 RepID=L0F671_DESDL|nr:thiamine pyrophosphate-binding protein [Desulfitobacterium dichloroeliminans]AGA68458.1 thiamine pyrophosphate-dependent enzyme, possible carboligase or decarboxylase [Desulfitobacterium dichloroeliminans LMG P-21439]